MRRLKHSPYPPARQTLLPPQTGTTQSGNCRSLEWFRYAAAKSIRRTPQRSKYSCQCKLEPLNQQIVGLWNGSGMRRRKAFTEPPSAANTLATANWNHSYHNLEWAGSGTSKKQPPNPPAQGLLLQHARTQPNLTLSHPADTLL